MKIHRWLAVLALSWAALCPYSAFAQQPNPVITAVNPASANAGSANVSVTISGSGFFAGTAIVWTGDNVFDLLSVTYISSTQLLATIPSDFLQTAGTAGITASNPGGSVSSTVTFTINPAGSGGATAPALTSLAPNSATAGGAAFTMTVSGTGFISGATVKWNGTSLTTTFVSATQLTALVPATLIQASGTANVVVANSAASTSGSLGFTINAAGSGTPPSLTSLTPNSAAAGGASFTLTAVGAGFVSGSSIQWNGSSQTTTFVSATQLTASITATLIQTAGSASVAVSNPGGSSSGSLSFTITGTSGATPAAISSLAPNTVVAGGAAFTLTVNGSGFVSGSTVAWNGATLPTTFVSSAQLTAGVSAALIQGPGKAIITVTNPGASASASVSLNINPAGGTGSGALIAALLPSAASAGGPSFLLTIAGTGFVSGDIVQWNGISLLTALLNNSQLITSVPAALIGNPGTASVAVLTPDGVVSSALTFTIYSVTGGGGLAISSLAPNTAVAGGGAFVLTVNGSGFVAGAAVAWNGASVATTFVSAAQILALVPASLIQNSGSASITVTNPGTVPSGAAIFTINPAGARGTPAPSISALSPDFAVVGASGFTLTVSGSGFVSGSVVQWNASALATTFVSTTQLTAPIPDPLLQATGAVSIAVANPGGSAAAASTFVIFPAASGGVPPVITSLTPNSTLFGSAPFVVIVNGTGFVPGSTLEWNSSSLTTTFLSNTLIAAAIPASLLQTVGNAVIVVFNPDGTVSAATTFSVNPLPPPALNSLFPPDAPAGKGSITLCANGSGFVSGAALQWNGSTLETGVLSNSIVCATVPPNLTAVPDTVQISVLNPNSLPSIPVAFNIIGPPVIAPNAVVPLFSSVPVIEPGSWVSIYGSNLADRTYIWNGDFPTTLGGVTVTINGKSAYLWSVSPAQINLQAPDDSETGIVNVVVTTSLGSATSSVILAPYGPSFSLLGDGKHAAGVILPSGGGTNDLLGPSGAFSFATRPVKPGETLVLFGVGFGPTLQPVPAGMSFSGATPTATPVAITIGGVPANVMFAGITQAGLYQFNLTVPALPDGDQPLQATVNGVLTGPGPVVTVRN